MSKNDYIILEGICKWAKVYEPVDDYSRTKKIFTIDLEVNDSIRAVLKSNGIVKKAKEADEEGKRYITLQQDVITDGETGEILTQPVVVGPDGKTKFEELIGNGSKVRVKLLVLTSNHKAYKNKKFMRFVGVQVVDHIRYEKVVEPIPDDEKIEGFNPVVGDAESDNESDEEWL